MRISDWSSDVCSSDLSRRAGTRAASRNGGGAAWSIPWPRGIDRLPDSPCAWGARQGATPCPFPQERLQPRALRPDRKDGVVGTGVSVRLDLCGCRDLEKSTNSKSYYHIPQVIT